MHINNEKKKIIIFLDHDIIIRHFILTNVFRQIESMYNVLYVFPESNKRVKVDVDLLKLKNIKKIKTSDTRTYLWRRLYQHQVLKNARKGDNKKHLYGFWREALGFRPFLKTLIMSFTPFFQIYKYIVLKKISNDPDLEQLIDDFKPNLILHPTVLEGLFVSDLILIGKKQKIPTVFLMNSWDNPATKAVLMGAPNWLVVWGEQTKKIAIENLRIKPEQVLMFGAAQFDVYKKPPKRNTEEVKKYLGINAQKKMIIYAGSSKNVNEIEHLIFLDNEIEKGIIPNSEIIFRPHPWRGIVNGEVDFFSIKWKNIKIDPEMISAYQSSKTGSKEIFFANIEYTHEILSACDLLISPVSTILLEAYMHGKPIIAYLPENDIPKNFFLREMAAMSFFKDFFEKSNSGPVKTSIELVDKIVKIITNSNIDEDKIKNDSRYFVQQTDKNYGELLKEHIEHII